MMKNEKEKTAFTISPENEKAEIDPEKSDGLAIYKIISGCIVPRPIGFITSVNSEGRVNAAPFSFFNGLSHRPPLVCFSVGRNSKMMTKDTLHNVRETGEFVVNIVDEQIAAQQNLCAYEFSPEVNELDMAKLTALPGKSVSVPRVAEAPANFECKVWRIVELPGDFNTLVIGIAQLIYVRKDVLTPEGRIDFGRLRAVGRMAGDAYCRTSDIFNLSYDAFDVVPKV